MDNQVVSNFVNEQWTDRLYRTLHGKVYLIQKDSTEYKGAIKTKKFSFDIFLDPNMQIFKKLNGNLMPTNVLIDKTGKVVWRHYGYLPGDEKKMEEQILNVLNILP